MAWSKDNSVAAKLAAAEALLQAERAELAGASVDDAIAEVDVVVAENKTQFLPAVATVALRDSTYPTPLNGDTVRVTGTSTTYRYSTGSGWVVTDVYNATAIDNVTAQLADKASKVDVQQISLSYKESYATLAALQTAYPTGNVYNHAVLADGLIYTYTTSWVSTGIQANGTGITNGTITKEKLSSEVVADYVNLKPAGNLVDFTKAITNKYYSNTGTLLTGDNTTFAIPKINLEIGKTYYFKTFTTVATFRTCFLDANGVVTAYKTGAEIAAAPSFVATTNESAVLISFYNGALNNFVFNVGSEPTKYVTQYKVYANPAKRGYILVNQNGEGDYTTIGSALSALVGKDTPTNKVTILVAPGIYNETIDITNRYVSIVTLDKARTIIKTETGHYDYPPVKAGGGDIFVKNLTMLATHEKPAASFPSENRAYALHLDYSGAGITVFEDCDIISHQCAALGSGTRPNRKHIFKNCKFELIDNGDGFNPASTKYGAVFAHSHQAVAEGYQNYEFHNCTFSSGYVNALRLLQSFSTFRCLFVNCFIQGTNKTVSMTNSVDAVPFIDSDSFGNNVSTINAP